MFRRILRGAAPTLPAALFARMTTFSGPAGTKVSVLVAGGDVIHVLPRCLNETWFEARQEKTRRPRNESLDHPYEDLPS